MNLVLEGYEEGDRKINYGLKYWERQFNDLQIKVVLDPHEKKVLLTILQRKPLMMASASISLLPLKRIPSFLQKASKEKDLLQTLFESIT